MDWESNPTISQLSEVQRKVLFMLENLQPYEKIEIKMDESMSVTIVSTHTTKESFPPL